MFSLSIWRRFDGDCFRWSPRPISTSDVISQFVTTRKWWWPRYFCNQSRLCIIFFSFSFFLPFFFPPPPSLSLLPLNIGNTCIHIPEEIDYSSYYLRPTIIIFSTRSDSFARGTNCKVTILILSLLLLLLLLSLLLLLLKRFESF